MEVIAIVEDVVIVYEAPVTVSKRGFGGEGVGVFAYLGWARQRHGQTKQHVR